MRSTRLPSPEPLENSVSEGHISQPLPYTPYLNALMLLFVLLAVIFFAFALQVAFILAGALAFLRAPSGCLMVFRADGLQIHLRLRQLHSQVLHGGGDDLRYSQVAEPFVIGRNDVPRPVFGAGFSENVLESFRVVVPQRAFLVVAVADLPVAHGIVEPLLKSFQLFFPADVQEELDDARVVL